MRFGWNVQPHVGALIWGSVEVPTVDAVEQVGSEAGDVEIDAAEKGKVKGKRGEGWSFKFPSVGAARKKNTSG